METLISCYKYLYILPVYLLIEWINNFLDHVFWFFPISTFLPKLILFNFHPLYLILVIKPHKLAWIFDCLYNGKGLCILLIKLLACTSKLLNQVLKLCWNKLTAVKYAVERSHLFVAIVSLDGILIDLVR